MLQYIAPTRRSKMTKARAAKIFLAANGVCELCGIQIRGERYEIEHRIALNLGGADDDANCYPAHVRCHKAKTASDKAAIAKRNRLVTASWAGKPKSRMPGSRWSPWKKKVSGEVVPR